MVDSNITIRVGSGTYNFLDKQYNIFIKNSLENVDDDTHERWVTYETIMRELVNLGRIKLFEEIKYRLTGGGDPNDIMLDIINRDNEVRTHLWFHISHIKGFKNDELIQRFYE
jgi:hypothetical protein